MVCLRINVLFSFLLNVTRVFIGFPQLNCGRATNPNVSYGDLDLFLIKNYVANFAGNVLNNAFAATFVNFPKNR